MAADSPFMEVTGRKDVQNGGRSILKMTTGNLVPRSLVDEAEGEILQNKKICFS